TVAAGRGSIVRSGRRHRRARRSFAATPAWRAGGQMGRRRTGFSCGSHNGVHLPNQMSTRYNVGIVGYSWAATAHIGAIAATSKGCVTDVVSSRPLDAEEL